MRGGHLHYRLAVIRPLLTVMGSFRVEATPAAADNTGDGHRGRQAAGRQALPSVAVPALALIAESIFQHNWGHFP